MKTLLSLIACVFSPMVLAQLSYKAEFELRPAGHLELTYAAYPLDFRLILDPGIQLNGPDLENAYFEPGLTEAYFIYQLERADISLGLERLALEYARLSLPFSLEPLAKTGQKQGVWGARASIYLDDWRFRPVLFYRSEDAQTGAAISLRKAFGDFELEAQSVYLNQQFSLGLGGSGLLGEIIVYGEGWLLSTQAEGRGALGLSGFWDDRLWTLELAYAPTLFTVSQETLAQLLGQISLPLEQNSSATISTAVSLAAPAPGLDPVLYGLFNAAYEISELDYSLSAAWGTVASSSSQAYTFSLSIKSFF